MTLSVLSQTVEPALRGLRSKGLGRVHRCGDAFWIAVHRAHVEGTTIRKHVCLLPAALVCPVSRNTAVL
jgi:hypothetical protein